MGPITMESPLGIDDDLGGIQLGYQPEELAKMFFEYCREHPTFHKNLREFQLRERHSFMQAEEQTAAGEHQLRWSEVHSKFVKIIEGQMVDFVQKSGCSEAEFAGAMEECKDSSSAWWTPFSLLLDVTNYEVFARTIQDNKCLCCAETFMGYQSEELVQMLLKYLRDHPTFHKQVRSFQLVERRRFVGVDENASRGEHRLEWSDVHRRFVELIESHFEGFIKSSGCIDKEFLNALGHCMNAGSASWPPFAKILHVSDYQVFSTMLQSNECLCCGQPFPGYQPEELAEKLEEYVQKHPSIHTEMRAFQARERGVFLESPTVGDTPLAAGEHRLEWTCVHQRFLQMIEAYVQDFMDEIHCDEDEFMAALRVSKTASTPSLSIFTWLLNTSDYEGFAKMLCSNVCLCCGSMFAGHEAAP